MFRRAIETLSPWTEEGLFGNVNAARYRDQRGYNDYSMVINLRALLSRRLPENVTLSEKVYSLTARDVDSTIGEIDYYAMVSSDGNVSKIDDLKNYFLITYFEGLDDEAAKSILNGIREHMTDGGKWKIHEKQDKFINQYIKMVALMNSENNTCLIVTDRPKMETWHLMQSMIPAYFSHLFVDIPLQKEEQDMLHALTMRNSQAWQDCLSTMEGFYDIRNKLIDRIVGNFEKRGREQQKVNIENEIAHLRSMISDNQSQYQSLMERLDDANTKLNGMVYRIGDLGDDNELVNFFKSNKSLNVVSTSGLSIRFIVKTYLENFGVKGEDSYETYRTNERFLDETCPDYCEDDAFLDSSNRRKFLDALIIDKKFKILMCAFYNLDLRGSVSTTSGYEFPRDCQDYVHNYHLDVHECFGDYNRVITNYLNHGDTVGAVNACITSAKSVNIDEAGATFNPMMRNIFRGSQKCVELPDGRHVTPGEALRWLDEE